LLTPTLTAVPKSSSSHWSSSRNQDPPTVLFSCRSKEVYEFAYTYPYSYTKLQQWLLSWERLHLPYLQRCLLCRTPQMKRIDALVIEEVLSDVGQCCMLSLSSHLTCKGFKSRTFISSFKSEFLDACFSALCLHQYSPLVQSKNSRQDSQ